MSFTRGDKHEKWTQPGWRTEQKYANKVLIGNWAEERLQFTRDPKTATSTQRLDYQPQWDFKPDVSARRAAQRRAEGPPSTLFFSHHATPPSHYLVTLYDESYGRRHNSALAARRSWHPDSLSWRPEASDHPIRAPPTNFGRLLETRRHRAEGGAASRLPLLSMSGATYQRHTPSAFCQTRLARAPRLLSSHLHAANHDNRDLHLRGCSQPQVPDHCFNLPPLLQPAQADAQP